MCLSSLICFFLLIVQRQLCGAATVDEDIEGAATSSDAFEFLRDNTTVTTELDIIYTREDWDLLQKYGQAGQETRPREKRDVERMKRKGVTRSLWKGGIVPYVFHADFGYSAQKMVKKSIAAYHSVTCLKLRPATPNDWNGKLVFQSGDGCSSHVGKHSLSQPVTLGRGCRTMGIILHEIGHAVGLHHEQCRPDRDEYVEIRHRNIEDNMGYNFKKYSTAVIPDWGVQYDYQSMMHYGSRLFSKNGRPTIVATKSGRGIMGNRHYFSFRDIKLLNLMYQCNSHCPKKTCPGEGFVDKECRCQCPNSLRTNPVKLCKGETDEGTGSESGTGKDGKGGKETGTGKDGKGGKETGTGKDGKGGKETGTGNETGKETGSDNKTGAGKETGSGVGSGKETGSGADKCDKACVDTDKYCHLYSKYCKPEYRKYIGFQFVSENCLKTCGWCCGVPEVKRGVRETGHDRGHDCTNRNQNCNKFASNGECKRNVVYMRDRCSKSCGYCDNTNAADITECKDSNPVCGVAASQGECYINPGYMNVTCRNSCGKC